ncbi:hypothetical protein INR49_007607, partial [Caranx melampygus]
MALIYIINLLISDIIQLCSMIVLVAASEHDIIIRIADFTYFVGLMASVCFMVCVTLERYLLIAWPLWYRFRRNIKTAVVICVVVWIVILVFCSQCFPGLSLRSHRSSLVSSSSFPSLCSYSSCLGPLKLCLQPSVSLLMKNAELWPFWFWCYLFTHCCSCPSSFGYLQKKQGVMIPLL